MARYFGKVGFTNTSETVSGVWTEEVVEKEYYGDVTHITRRIAFSSEVNPDISTSTTISIVADAYATQHFFNIIYAEWQGAKWTVTNVEVQRPRLLLSLGGVYNE